MTCEALFHHAIEYCTRFDEALIHRDQVGCEAGRKSSTLREVTKTLDIPRFWLYLSINFTIFGRSVMQER